MDRLKSQRVAVRAYLQSAKILTDILTYAIWWRLFTKASYMTTSTRIYSLWVIRVGVEPQTPKT